MADLLTCLALFVVSQIGPEWDVTYATEGEIEEIRTAQRETSLEDPLVLLVPAEKIFPEGFITMTMLYQSLRDGGSPR